MAVYCAVVIFFVNVVFLMQEGIGKISGYVEEESQIVSYTPYCIPIGIIIIVLSFIWLLATFITILNKPGDLLRVIKVFMSYFTYHPRSWASFPKNIQKHFGRKFNIVFLLILGQ